jgi:hypothetical protein
MSSQHCTSERIAHTHENDDEAEVLVRVRIGVDGRSPYSAAQTWLKRNIPDAREIVTIDFCQRPDNGFDQILLVTYKVAETELG